MYDWDPVTGEMRNFRILRNGETPYPGEDHFVPDGAGRYAMERADTEEENESSKEDGDETMDAAEEGIPRVEEIEFEHPMIFVQDDRPGIMFEATDTYRILDPNIDSHTHQLPQKKYIKKKVFGTY